jgi:hypothetical protein
MMKRTGVLLLARYVVPVLGVFIFGGSTFGKPHPRYQVLPVGAAVFYDKVEDIDAHDWLGLFATPTGYELRPVKPVVEAAPPGPVDQPGQPPVERLVTAKDEDVQPLYLFTGLPAHVTGPVPTLFEGYVGVQPGTLSLGRHPRLHGALVAKGSRSHEGADSYEGYSLSLHRWEEGQMRTQVLIEVERTYLRVPGLIWAGDLDRDGKLDLIIDAGTSIEGGTFLKLYLSTEAGDGEIVGVAAEIGYGGC